MCVCWGMCLHEFMNTTFMQVPTERAKGVRFPETGVKDNFEPLNVFITECRTFARIVSTFNCEPSLHLQ